MTLGERIRDLRTAAGLSQEALAERLGVSRQSLSKWETDTSVPELDKLLILREVFGMSLDALVTGETIPSPSEGAPAPAQTAPPFLTAQHIIGFILLAAGLLCCILDLIFTRGLLYLGGYLVLCSIVCFAVRHNAGLVIGWVSVALFLLFGAYFTGINLVSSLYHVLLGYTSPVEVVIPLLFLGAILLLLFFTVRALLRRLRRNR